MDGRLKPGNNDGDFHNPHSMYYYEPRAGLAQR